MAALEKKVAAALSCKISNQVCKAFFSFSLGTMIIIVVAMAMMMMMIFVIVMMMMMIMMMVKMVLMMDDYMTMNIHMNLFVVA